MMDDITYLLEKFEGQWESTGAFELDVLDWLDWLHWLDELEADVPF